MLLRRLFILLFLILPTRVVAEKTASPLEVGVALALSGPAAAFCVPVKNGIELALAQLSPKEREAINVTYEDDQATSAKTVSAYRKLRASKNITTFISCSSGTSKAVAPLTNGDAVPHIAIASDYEVVRGKNYVVNLWVTPAVEAPLLKKEAVKREYKKIARITALHDGTLAFKRAFDEINRNPKIEIVLDEDYNVEERDFRTFLAKLSQKRGVDAIFLNLFSGQLGLFAKQAREMGVELPLFNFELFEDPQEVKLSKGALHNQWYVQADAGTESFLKRYREAYPEASTFAAANGYDAMLLLASAIRAGKTSHIEINEYLHTLKDFTGALGTYSSSGDNRFTLPATLKVVTKNGFKKIE